jgi:hypothetical protein
MSSCSSTHQAYLRSLDLAFSKPHDFVLESEQIRQSPADLLYVTKGELGTAVLALAYIENGQYKWISSDNVALIEKNGRIIKTLSSSSNLDFVTSTSADPLENANNITSRSVWQRIVDFEGYFGVEINSTFHVVGVLPLTIQEQTLDAVLIEEQVNIGDGALHQFDDTQWTNQFWVHKETGQLLRSRQKLFPNGLYFDMIYVSRALRL